MDKSPGARPVLVNTSSEGIPGWWTFVFMSDAVIGLKRLPPKSKKCGQKCPLLPSLRRLLNPTAERRCILVAHERVAEGFRLVFTAPSLCSREISGRATKHILLCAAAACRSIPITKIYIFFYLLLYRGCLRVLLREKYPYKLLKRRLATAQETLNPTARKLHFKLYRLKSTRKVLPRCHTTASAPKSPSKGGGL